MNDRPPRRIYKYRSISNEIGKKTCEDIVLHNRLWWQSPSMFNDIFDCAPHLTLSSCKTKRRRMIDRAVNENVPDADRNTRRYHRKLALSRPHADAERFMQEDFTTVMSQSAVSCFSLDPASLLMWSHYADSHKGVCFIFEESLSVTNIFFAFDVEYTELRPSIELNEFLVSDGFTKTVLTKGASWSYEREVRMFEFRKPAGPRSFPQHCLKGIVLGARSSAEDRDWIEGLIMKRRTAFERWVAKASGLHFRLELLPLEDRLTAKVK